MKILAQEETLSPWQIEYDSIHEQFQRELDKDNRTIAFTCSESPSRYTSVPSKKREKENRKILNQPKSTTKVLKNWGSMSVLRNSYKPAKQRPASSNLKNQLRKYLMEEDQFSNKKENRNKVNFTPLNFVSSQNYSSVRRGIHSAAVRGKRMNKIQVKGVKIYQRRTWDQDIDLSEKMNVLTKQVTKQCSSDTMRSTVNRFFNNYTKEEIKLKPVCLKLKLSK